MQFTVQTESTDPLTSHEGVGMRIGYCANMLSTQPDGTGFEHLEDIRSAGFDYVELPMVQMQNMGMDFVRDIDSKLKAIGLPCETSNNFLSSAYRITGPDVNWDKLRAYLERMLTYAELLGIDTLVVGSPGARDVPEGFPHQRAYEQLVEFFRFLSDWLPNGMVAAIEPVCKLESNIIHTVSEGVALMRDVARENISVLADFFHMKNEGESPAVLSSCGKRLVHVHFSPINPRSLPLVLDEDMKFFLTSLKNAGYDKRISIEAKAASREEMTNAYLVMRELLPL